MRNRGENPPSARDCRGRAVRGRCAEPVGDDRPHPGDAPPRGGPLTSRVSAPSRGRWPSPGRRVRMPGEVGAGAPPVSQVGWRRWGGGRGLVLKAGPAARGPQSCRSFPCSLSAPVIVRDPSPRGPDAQAEMHVQRSHRELFSEVFFFTVEHFKGTENSVTEACVSTPLLAAPRPPVPTPALQPGDLVPVK